MRSAPVASGGQSPLREKTRTSPNSAGARASAAPPAPGAGGRPPPRRGKPRPPPNRPRPRASRGPPPPDQANMLGLDPRHDRLVRVEAEEPPVAEDERVHGRPLRLVAELRRRALV